MSGLYCDVKKETFPIPLSCQYKRMDNLLKLFNAAGLWIFFLKDLCGIFQQSKGCDLMHAFEYLVAMPLSFSLTGSNSS